MKINNQFLKAYINIGCDDNDYDYRNNNNKRCVEL